MKEYRKVIINSINQNSFRNNFLLEIYEEDNLVDKFFKGLKEVTT